MQRVCMTYDHLLEMGDMLCRAGAIHHGMLLLMQRRASGRITLLKCQRE